MPLYIRLQTNEEDADANATNETNQVCNENEMTLNNCLLTNKLMIVTKYINN